MVSYWGDQKVKGRQGHYAAWFWLIQPYDWNLPDGGRPQLFIITYRLQSPSKAWCHGSVEWHEVEGWALQTHTSLYITLSQIAWHSIALHHITLYHIALLFILGQHKNKHSVQALSNGLRIALASAPLPSFDLAEILIFPCHPTANWSWIRSNHRKPSSAFRLRRHTSIASEVQVV